MADSIHTTNPSASRRAVVTGLAVAPVMALPAVAGEAHPDAELLRLYAEWKAAADECDRLDELVNDLEGRAYVPMYEACLARDGDVMVGLTLLQGPHGPTGGAWYPPHSIEKMRRFKLARLDPSTQERITEILEAYDAHEEAEKRAEQAVGLKEAQARREAAEDNNYALREAIAALPAQTVKGAAVKAHVAVWCCGGMESLTHDLTADATLTDTHFMRMVVSDLLRITGTRLTG